MKKNVKVLLSVIALIASFSIGGLVVYAYSGGWLESGNAYGYYESTDQATLEVYQDTRIDFEYYAEEENSLDPSILVKTIKDCDGNDVDFSKLDVSYQIKGKNPVTNAWGWQDISPKKILDKNGNVKLEEYGEVAITYTYEYDMQPKYIDKKSVISKTVYVYEGIY